MLRVKALEQIYEWRVTIDCLLDAHTVIDAHIHTQSKKHSHTVTHTYAYSHTRTHTAHTNTHTVIQHSRAYANTIYVRDAW